MIPPVKRLLITRHDKIGDFVLALPLCKTIKEAFPDIYLAVLVSKVNFEFAKEVQFIDGVILLDSDFVKTLQQIKQQKFDASISCFIDNRLGWLLWRAGIPKRIAPATKLAQLFFNATVRQRRSHVEKTEWRYNIDLGAALFPIQNLEFTPPLIQFENLSPKSRVVLHPGFGGSSDGNIRLEDYLRLGRHAAEIPGMEVMFTFGPDDHASHDWIQNHLDFPATLLQSKLSLMEFCRLLAESRLFISTSTGPMHLAGAVNISTLSFFGNSAFASSRRWATISEPQRQRNFMLNANYCADTYNRIEAAMLELLS